MRVHARFRVLLSTSVILAGCASGDGGTAPIQAASAALTSTTSFTATVGTALATAPSFVVRDASGNGIGDVGVSITVGTGGGTLTGAPTKSSANGTSVGVWTLGNTAGANTLVVTVNGLATPLTISATGTPDVPTQVTVPIGNSQNALAGATLLSPVTFKVGDRFNNGVSNISVSFSITAGGGSLPAGSATVVTDAGGLAVAPTWTLGKSTGTNTLRGTAGALTGTASATVTSNFSLEVRFFGTAIDPAIQAAFLAAASRIQGLVTGDLSDVNAVATNLSGCGITGVAPLTEVIDDVIVYAQVAPIDDAFGILGSTGVCLVRLSNGLTTVGVMNFDSADLQRLLTDGTLSGVILHEMLHAVGVGTLWASKAQLSNVGTASVAFIGQQAVSGCLFHGGVALNQCGSGTVPVEAGFGSGTANLHWRENTTATGVGLNQELMTGFAEAAGIPMPLSRITIGSLADIGYVTNLLAADAYNYPSTASAALAQIREGQGLGAFELREIILEPIGMIDAAGRVTPLKPRQ